MEYLAHGLLTSRLAGSRESTPGYVGQEMWLPDVTMGGASQGLQKGKENHHGREGTLLEICRPIVFLDLCFMLNLQVIKEMGILLDSPESKANAKKIK